MQKINAKTGDFLKRHAEELAFEIWQEYRKMGADQGKSLQEQEWVRSGIARHLFYLSESLLFSESSIYENAVGWAEQYLLKTGLQANELKSLQKASEIVFERSLPPGLKENVLSYLSKGFSALEKRSYQKDSYLDERVALYQQSCQYLDLLLKRKKTEAAALVFSLINAGISLKDIYMEIFAPVLKEVGRLWIQEEQTLAFGHYATAVTELIMSQLYHHIFKTDKGDRVFIGACVFGELHEIGLRMICDLLAIDGWKTRYMGANAAIDEILMLLRESQADVAGLSVTMAQNLKEAERLIQKIKGDQALKKTKVIVGGYVFNHSQDLWRKIGADDHAKNAADALSLIKELS